MASLKWTRPKAWTTQPSRCDDQPRSVRGRSLSACLASKIPSQVPAKAQFYGISGLLSKPINPADGLALQFELKLGSDAFGCGGAYLKFLTADAKFVPKDLKDDSPYTIMFGPDKCGATNKVHLIFRHKNPKTGTIEEKHLKAPPIMSAGTETHVYTAVVKPDNTYAILIDGKESKAGSLFEDFEPPFLPPKEIPDPEDSKPSDWVDEAKYVVHLPTRQHHRLLRTGLPTPTQRSRMTGMRTLPALFPMRRLRSQRGGWTTSPLKCPMHVRRCVGIPVHMHNHMPQLWSSPMTGTMRRTVSGSPRWCPTPNAIAPLAAVSGSGPQSPTPSSRASGRHRSSTTPSTR